MRSRRFTVLLGGLALAALIGGSAAGVTAQSDISTWKTEEVEPGVLRVLDDGAGHDLTERYPDNHRDMDHIAIAGDGSVWIAGTASGGDNDFIEGFLVWPLGQEGLYTMEDGVPAWIALFEFAPDGTLWAMGDGIGKFDGGEWSSTTGSHRLVAPDGTAWFASVNDGVESWDGEAFTHHLADRWVQSLSIADDGTLWAVGDGLSTFDGETWSSGDGSKQSIQTAEGIIWETHGSGVDRVEGNSVTRYLQGRPINQIALAPDGALWAIGAVSEMENGGVYRIEPPSDT